MKQIRDDFSSPFKDVTWPKKIALGSLCYLLFVTAPIMVGYRLRILQETANGETDSLPSFQGPWQLFVRGSLLFLSISVFFITPALLVFGFGFLPIFLGYAPEDAYVYGQNMAMVAIVLGLLVSVLLAPAMTIVFSQTDSLLAMYNPVRLFSVVFGAPLHYLAMAVVPTSLLLGSWVLLSPVYGLGNLFLGDLLALMCWPLVTVIQGRLLGSYVRLHLR